MAEAISVKNICKEFPGVKANQDVSLSIEKGEIRAIIGENGAGKTTLMNILYGLYHPDSGSIFIKGEEVKFHNARAAMAHGIGMVHQHFKLVPSFTLGQNIVLGVEPKKAFFVDNKKVNESVKALSDKYRLPIDPEKLTLEASVGEQQRAEILKALYRGADILILDEPTAVLTDMETEELFVMLRGLAQLGKTILFISHKLREVLAISDNTTVMRLGKVIGTVKTSETDTCQLAEMMIGRETEGGRMREDNVTPGETVLEVKGISVRDERTLLAVRNASFEMKSGEILGIAGVDGNGQEELIEAIIGLRPVVGGEILVNGKNITQKSTRQIRESGVSYIPSDRYKSGVAVDAHVWENLIAVDYFKSSLSSLFLLHVRNINQLADNIIERFNVVTPNSKTQTGHLSGGNIQRLIVGRELGSERATVVIASQPTRGIDIAGTEAIRQNLIDYTKRGAGVLLISADLDEILTLSDRVIVLYEGEVFDAGKYDDKIRKRVGDYMTGLHEEGCEL
ncbi:MAG: ABC transporter ATP-binding protein [bacterium]